MTAQEQSADDSLYEAVVRRLYRRTTASGRIALPAVPALLDEYVTLCHMTFIALGVHFTEEQLAALRSAIEQELAEGFRASSRAELVISYDSPIGHVVNYRVHTHAPSVEATYDNWKATRTPPYFGSEPDARVLAASRQVPDPGACPVLDVGAGTGRNALVLAHRGHPVDAVEPTTAFADSLVEAAERDSLNVRVIRRNIFDVTDEVRSDYGLIVVAEVTSDFRSASELRRLFEIAADRLAPGGHLVVSVFVTRPGYVPDDAARQLAQQCYSTMFTPAEVADAAKGLALTLASDDSVHDFEKAHLPAVAWPPTNWYAEWVSGQDVFDVPREESPVELRWLVYRRD